MRRPRMSTGAWIFTGLVCAAVIAPASVFAASAAKTALVGLHGTNAADVTAQHQLLTATIPPSHVVHVHIGVPGPCQAIYKPPRGKAIVVTSVVYAYGSGTQGTENFGSLFTGAGCNKIYDRIDQIDKFGSIQHTFSPGLPMANVYGQAIGGQIDYFVTGYLIGSGDLP